ncbi:class I SAM-dependent methyltransferase [Ancylobacter sp. A5.8]|uniref:class I SAM-dependent methyltransferase n=1 Tax=Ancylobacter gelatini TaxID=2919920 RepID=UPI001F4D8225|nr:class I SAM-dependent methyltransferase [Ancylobacter gelatini]MCJ8143325.1 class I SAM-dependent methyltransferase [Ancylobacter gelatini]
MSGFDPGWLELREPVDHAARNAAVADRVRRYFAERASLTLVDLGCGTGSNLRALAPSLAPRQHWHLVDGDPVLLDEARRVLARWADHAQNADDGIRLGKNGRHIHVSFECADLTRRDLHFADIAPDLVTAAALFDLVSEEWLERLVAASAERRVSLYAVLNYDGIARWQPETSLDQRIVAAFNRHQRRDKGFGPALGPASSEAFASLLSRHGYRHWVGDSPWHLGSDNRPLAAALVAGIATAAGDIEPDMAEAFAAWAGRRAGADVTIGHQDIFATF